VIFPADSQHLSIRHLEGFRLAYLAGNIYQYTQNPLQSMIVNAGSSSGILCLCVFANPCSRPVAATGSVLRLIFRTLHVVEHATPTTSGSVANGLSLADMQTNELRFVAHPFPWETALCTASRPRVSLSSPDAVTQVLKSGKSNTFRCILCRLGNLPLGGPRSSQRNTAHQNEKRTLTLTSI